MSNNVFGQTFQRHKQKNEAREQKTKMEEDVFLATLSNGKTYADEAILIVRGVLILLTGFVIYLGFNYYLETFREMFPEWAAVFFAIAIPVVVEAGKIKLSMLGLRSILFGWWWQTWASVAFWLVIIGLSVGTFIWSYTISTGGIKEVAREKSETKNELPPLENVIASATADIDAQIAALTASNTEAATMKTKKGKTTWAGQVIQMNNSEALPSLQDQRAITVRETTAAYKTKVGKVEVKVNRWAGFIQRFGGWGEWGTLICVVAIGFFELRLREVNRKEPDEPKSNATNGHFSHISKPEFVKNDHMPQSELRRPIGFMMSATKEIATEPLHSAPHHVSGVAHQHTDSDAVLKVARQDSGRWYANFGEKENGGNGKHNPRTVSNHINAIIDGLRHAIQQPHFSPSRKAAIKAWEHFSGLMPLLNEKGWPYDHGSLFLEELHNAIPPED